MFKLIAVLALLAIAVSAQTPQPCSTPFEWQGDIFVVDPEKHAAAIAQISYDSLHQRTNTYERVYANGKHYDFQFLALYQDNVGYEINLDDKTCKAVHIPSGTFRPFALPSNATFDTELTLGLALDVQVWSGQFADPRGGLIRWMGGVTADGCIPVFEDVAMGDGNFIHQTFSNIVIGIPNINIWIPPKYCNTAEVHAESSPFNSRF
ncbi:uncharacterized protein AMSG_05009 [Thecamonas trahens ATCC 50062]|uniref:Uncharacterized protein n=1 Tax=Thecamonas trahens ATCC 50062 TaxID=461836 RepID=A0A0L0D9N2_THETB|nr:hypothetical protein AMSG_05009 [Thecamonas trahens ATCC 50062]KNC49049.1 hypothetical protein AMSG_05009 [Thecamonas trahens ATCC 50062]|eukprot:XP_013758084.1 hypothetical protein AMSG_05009 [Thecamonas trahens ATCC 50062]